jgi:hypothetical protein
LPNNLLPTRKAYLSGVAKADAESIQRKQRVVADYVRALAALELRSAGKAELLAQIAKEKDGAIRSAPLELAKVTQKLGGSKWRSSGNSNLTLNEDGTYHSKKGAMGTWKVLAVDRIEMHSSTRGPVVWTLDTDGKTLTTDDSMAYIRQN